MTNDVPHKHLNDSVDLIRDLLKKQRLVEAVVHGHQHERTDLVETLVHRQHVAELQRQLRRLHIADIAHALESLPPDDRHLVWEQLGIGRRGDVLLEVSDAVRSGLIKAMDAGELTDLLRQLDADDLAYIAEELPAGILQARLQELNHEDRRWLQSSMAYEEDTVGALMSAEMVTVRAAQRLDEALADLRALKELPIHADKLFVVDQRGLFVGVLPVQTLLLADPSVLVRDAMASDVVRFMPDDDAREAAQAFERYDLASAPVLNERGKLVGRLTVDVVMDYIREESADDVLGSVGLSGTVDLYAPVWQSARSRWLWLSLNLLTAFVASRVIGLFEDTISQLVALAALMPIVASIGGNTGNQTTALIIRGLAMGQIDRSTSAHLLRNELGVGLLNGALLGVLVGLFALAFYHDPSLGLVIAAAVVLNLVVAALVGLAVPLLLDRLGRDPAMGSSVLLTATTDSMGFLIFLGLATVFLL